MNFSNSSRETGTARARPALRNLTVLAALAAATSAASMAQTQANPFLDDSTVQVINLTMDPNDWATLLQNYQLDTYYHGTFTWKGITENIGIRSHGGGSRSPIKPNLDLNFTKYDKTQTFLGLPFVVIKANNEDASNLREWISMKLFRKMGLPAPREAPAQVFINGERFGFYYIVEHEDETFLSRNFGENGGYLYQWQPAGYYDFENLGTDPSLYSQFLDLKTSQTAPDLQTFTNLVQAINRPPSSTFSDADFVQALSQYLDPKEFLTYGATEQALAGADSLIGGIEGMNNFYLYQFQGTTRYFVIPWDKDMTFSIQNRDIMDGITTGPNINVLAQRLTGLAEYRQVYLGALTKAAILMGGPGSWADQEITREYNVIKAAATDDPNKQCMTAGVLNPCGRQDFENDVQWLHTFLSLRSGFVISAAYNAGYQASESDPRIAPDGISAMGGIPALSPGSIAAVTGTNFGSEAKAPGGLLPRVLGNTYVSVEGVRAPLFATESGSIGFQTPGDIPVGSASIVVCNDGAMSNTVAVVLLASTPGILSVLHMDGSAVSQSSPVVPGETLSLYATGLGAVSGNLPIGAAGPSDVPATTLGRPQVLLGNVPLTVTLSALAPGVVGLYQVNVAVPSTWVSDSAQISMVLTADGLSAQWQGSQ